MSYQRFTISTLAPGLSRAPDRMKHEAFNLSKSRRRRVNDPEDTLRFYALRLREVGMIKSAPNKLIAEAADWRFLNELKRELKICSR